MKVSKKRVFAVVYIVVAFVAYVLFFIYSYSRFSEERAVMNAEFLAKYPSLKGFEPDYWFVDSVYWRNVVWVGVTLVFGGLIGAFALTIISDVRSARRKSKA